MYKNNKNLKIMYGGTSEQQLVQKATVQFIYKLKKLSIHCLIIITN